jgi:8-oxo-dGTP pyrophosphatase MutT (NUDIX family)
MKKLSCGTLIVRDRMGTKELFMGHVTGQQFWDIPKGGKNLHENYIEAAIRELEEESGFTCDHQELLDLGLYQYTERKDLYLFKYVGQQYFCDQKAFCKSTFFSKLYETRLPEMDGFKYVPFEQVLSHCSEGFKKVFPLLIEKRII